MTIVVLFFLRYIKVKIYQIKYFILLSYRTIVSKLREYNSGKDYTHDIEKEFSKEIGVIRSKPIILEISVPRCNMLINAYNAKKGK